MPDSRGGSVIFGAFLGAIGLGWLATRAREAIPIDEIGQILTARYGDPGGVFPWADLVGSETATRLGIDNLPPPSAAGALLALTRDTLEPLALHSPERLVILQGYVSPGVLGQLPASACRLRGHTDGTAVDVQLDGAPAIEILRRLHGIPFRRAVLAAGHVHLESQAGDDRRLACVRLPGGLIVPAGGFA